MNQGLTHMLYGLAGAVEDWQCSSPSIMLMRSSSFCPHAILSRSNILGPPIGRRNPCGITRTFGGASLVDHEAGSQYIITSGMADI